MQRFRTCAIALAFTAGALLAPAAQATAIPTKDPQIILKLSFSRLVVGKRVQQSTSTMKTDRNAAAELSSVTPTICKVSGFNPLYVTGLKVGTCRLKAYAPGMAGKFPSATRYYTVSVVAG